MSLAHRIAERGTDCRLRFKPDPLITSPRVDLLLTLKAADFTMLPGQFLFGSFMIEVHMTSWLDGAAELSATVLYSTTQEYIYG
jgi:hypothetical protein